jgi:3-deoxy-D-manno-octulosonic-acid transferase
MQLIYATSIHFYAFMIRMAALFGHKKAVKWVEGRKNLYSSRLEQIFKQQKTAWFHCASLGEFEQGRPVLEAFKKKYPDYKILLTFFSPSGYEVRQNYEGADGICYLPVDTKRKVRAFLDFFEPSVAFFVKYEFWFNYLNALKKRDIPVFLISGIFRKQQHFFRWYGRWFRKQLDGFTCFFLQNQNSKTLIDSFVPGKSILSGDTRFDRVVEIAAHTRPFPAVREFTNGQLTFIAGSTWPEDEKVILTELLKNKHIKVILAPHEVDEKRIDVLMKQLPHNAVRYSKMPEDMEDIQFLVIDTIGMLSHLYQYADIAYIGGGFGAGIHNTLEAATFGLPVMFGPHHQKFQEADDLLQAKGAFSIANAIEFHQIFNQLVENVEFRKTIGKNAADYVIAQKGATTKIMNIIQTYLP